MSFLSQVQGRPVFDANGQRVGMLRDLLIRPDVPYPPVTAVAVAHDGHLLSVPWHEVASVTPRGTALRGKFTRDQYHEPSDDYVWLARDVLDKQIVDISGVKLVRVNDVALTPLNDELRVAGVDNSTSGLFRRIGIERAAHFFDRRQPRLIDWEQVEIGTALNEVRLKVSYDRLHQMRPADIADVISQMSPGTAAHILEKLREETAARAMSALPDRHRAAILTAMEIAEAADVLTEMEPDEAADILGEVNEERAQEIMARMEVVAADEVRSLLNYAEDTAGGIMTTCITVQTNETVAEAIARLRTIEEPEENIAVLFAVDDQHRLRGSVSLRDLLIARPDAHIGDIMRIAVESVKLHDLDDTVARKLVRHNLLAIPVIDDEEHVKGIVTVNDVLDLMTPRSWNRSTRRMIG